MQKKWFIGLLVIAALLVLWSLAPDRDDATEGTAVLGERARLLVYSIEDNPTGGGFVEFTAAGEAAAARYLNVFLASPEPAAGESGFVQIDPPSLTIGGSTDSFPGLIEPQREPADEWIVRNMPVTFSSGETLRVAFRVPPTFAASASETSVRVALSEEAMAERSDAESLAATTLPAMVEQIRLVEEFGYNVPGSNEYLKRGLPGVFVAQAGTSSVVPATAGRNTDVPDLNGGPMDCVAIATANNLISLVNEHGYDVDFPEPGEMIEELKDDMQWDNGILTPNFLTGKAAFIRRYNLPVKTETITRPSIRDIADALDNGSAVEISLSFIRSASGRDNAGHVVTGVGVSTGANGTSITVHDPATPIGQDNMDTMLSGGDTPFVLLDYPFWDGITVIDAIHVQTWTGASDASMIENTTGVTDTTELMGRVPEMAYAHVAPGEYSEVYVRVPADRGQSVGVTLSGPSIQPPTTQVLDADENGEAYFVFRIYRFGTYTAKITVGETTITKSVTVK